MIKKPAGYDTAAAYDGSRETLPPGGYICKILGAGVEKVSVRGKMADKFVLRVDIDDGTPLSGFFMRQHRRNQQMMQGGTARWRGTYETFIETSDGMTNPFFKGLIKCIEASNPGYTWNWDERSLENRKVGLIFGEERYIGNDGKVHTTCRARAARTVEAIRAGVETPQLIDRTGGRGLDAVQTTATVVEDEDLPF